MVRYRRETRKAVPRSIQTGVKRASAKLDRIAEYLEAHPEVVARLRK